MIHCKKCGAELPPGAQFCSRCGTSIAAPAVSAPTAGAPMATGTASPPRSPLWWIVPLAVVGIAVVAWLALAGLPVRREPSRPAPPPVETIAEGTTPSERTPADTGTLVDVPQETPPPVIVEERPAPPSTQTLAPTQTLPPTQTPPAQTPPAQTLPPIQATPPTTPPPSQPAAEISSSEANATLRDYLASSRYYPTSGECLRIQNRGYRNRGYMLEVWDTCGAGGGSRLIGRWRVDSKTRELFRQRDDGRYLRP